ncbi:MAG: hypothetical protein K9J13_04895 [Saprospiraceae bacterium]|nr:hypothetical protein [Saprospiraceae bacterium]
MDEITKETGIKDLLEAYPGLIKFLRKQGIECVVHGEPVWGTIEEMTTKLDWREEEIDELIKELNYRAK